jgi:AbrB family looped-hinge helix DNA binding protein
VTIPKRIRDLLDLEEGTELEFVVSDDGTLSVRPKRPPLERLRDLQTRLSQHEVDIDELRRESRQAWGPHLDRGDRP